MSRADGMRYIMFVFERGDRLTIDESEEIVHLVEANNDCIADSGATKVRTACGRHRFVTYTEKTEATANCIQCLAMFEG